MPWQLYHDVLTAPYYVCSPTIEARNGIIKTIQNPYGGTLQFEYEKNAYGSLCHEAYGGVRVKKTSEFDGIDHAKDVIKEYRYINEAGNSSAWGYESQNRTATAYTQTWHCNNNTRYAATTFSQYASYLDIPQLAIGSFQNYNNWMAGSYASSPPAEYLFTSAMMQVAMAIAINLLYDLISPASTTTPYTIYNQKSFISHNLLPFQYSRVEVINKLSSETVGKSACEFTSPADQLQNPLFAIDVPTLGTPYSNKQRCAMWLYGSLKKLSIYDKESHLIKETVNTYTPFKYSLTDPRFTSQKWTPSKRIFDCDFIRPYDYHTTVIDGDIYSPICGRLELSTTQEKTYNSNNEYTLNTTNYSYSLDNYLCDKITSTNSKGELIETNTYYPQDYLLTGTIQTMKEKNIFNVPISSQTLITKGGGQKYLLNGSVTEFAPASNGDIKPFNTYVFRNDNPVVSTSVPFSNSQLLPNSNYYPQTGSVNYDAQGNVSQVNAESGKTSIIYDYDYRLVVANVVNANADDIAYSSFEAVNSGGTIGPQTPSGGWLINPGSTIVTERSLTGKFSFSGRLDKTLIHPGNYTVTLWGHPWGTVTVNGQAGTALANVGDWRLFEWKMTNVSSVTILADNVDEVRLYPSNATMTTYTYNPLIGKTSECDASNRITYYEYDDLGRLQFIRDENRNILKMYEYNYKR
jgi:YD repeat-containing protein